MRDRNIFYRDGATMVSLLVRQGQVVARGLSVCSRADDFDSSKGRQQALARALEAAGRGHNCHPIKVDVSRAAWADAFHLQLAADRFGYFKGFYKPALTNAELLLVR